MPAATRNLLHCPSHWAMTPSKSNQRILRSRPYHDSLDEARRYAQRLVPGANLSYIPKRERNIKNWIDDNKYLDPKLGSLHWCDNKPPKTRSAMATTRMYVMEDLVGASVDAVVRAVKERYGRKVPLRNNAWNWRAEKEVRERVAAVLKTERERVPGGFWGPMEHITADQVYDMIASKEFSRANFAHWVDIQPWTGNNGSTVENLTGEMQLMSVAASPTRVEEALVEEEIKAVTGWSDPTTVDWEYWENDDEGNAKAEALKEAMLSEITPLLGVAI
jgi:hypothetical protein